MSPPTGCPGALDILVITQMNLAPDPAATSASYLPVAEKHQSVVAPATLPTIDIDRQPELGVSFCLRTLD